MLTMDFPGFKVTGAETSGNTTCVFIEAIVDRSRCPKCGQESRSVHSRYVRRLRDLPAFGHPVQVRALVRRFRCKDRGCTQKTFSEPLAGLALPSAQRTQRVTTVFQSLILCASSITGARLARQMGLQTSPRTLLRVVNHGERSVAAPRILGVDDFAFRRGRTYGTVLCDLETGRPIDILLGRAAEPLTVWLKQHPGIEVIARDRATAYADAARIGAPEAIQVADRFHLVRNVSEALREVVDRQPWALPKPADMPVSVVNEVVPAPKLAPRVAARREVAAERLRIRYEEVRQRYAKGESLRAISKATGLERKTVRKYIRSATAPKYATRRPVHCNLDPFVDYLGGRWREGCYNASKLFAEIKALGYTGGYSVLRDLVHPWRTAVPVHGSGARRHVWKEVRWTILCPPERLNQEQREYLQQLFALQPKLELAHGLLQAFRQLLREHQVAGLDRWLQGAATSGLAPFERLAKTLTTDKAAVRAAVELPWSTGRVEGINTRIKLMKRLGYGRASLPLLRARITGVCQ